MTAIEVSPGDLRWEAARLASAALRFAEGAAHLSSAYTPAGSPVLGRDSYIFAPGRRHVMRAQIENFLVSLPSAAFLHPTTTRGVIALSLLDELSGDRHRWGVHALNEVGAGVERLGAAHGLSLTSRVLLEFEEESHVFDLATVREYLSQFHVDVGWLLEPIEGDTRAEAWLMLFRSDGKWSRGPR